MHDRTAGRPAGIAAARLRRARPLANRLRRFDLQAARAIEHAIDDHARFARRRPEA
jgi:hypothetical protein